MPSSSMRSFRTRGTVAVARSRALRVGMAHQGRAGNHSSFFSWRLISNQVLPPTVAAFPVSAAPTIVLSNRFRASAPPTS